MLNECGWLSISQLVFYHNVLQAYKTLATQRPGYLYNKFSRKFGANNRYPTSLHTSNAIRIEQRIRTDLGLKNFTYVAAQQWNQLPVAIRRCPTLESFKASTKRWIRMNIAIWLSPWENDNCFQCYFYFPTIINPSRTLHIGSVCMNEECMGEWLKSFHF